MISAELVIVAHHVPFLSWEACASVLLGCLAGTLADVDKQGSTMAKVLFPLSAALRILQIRHRTLTHSLIFILAIMLAATALPPLFYWVLVVSYFSHPLIDLLNDKGVQLFWPIKFNVRLLPKFMAIDTGSFAETVFQWILIVISLWIPFKTIPFG